MASYTTGLKLTQPNLGDTGWGTTVNSGVTALVDQAVAGAVSVAVTAGGTTTLSAIADGASSDARNMSLLITGSLTTGQTATVRVPATGAGVTKLYSIRNEAGQTVAVETSGGDAVNVPHNRALLVRVTSTGVYEAVNYAASLTLGTALAATSGGTGQSSYAVGDLLYAGTTTTLAKLASVATGNVLRAGGVGTAPAWGKVDLTTDVTGILPSGNVALPDATDSVKGAVELATTAEVQAGTDATRAITPASLRGGALVLGTVKAPTSGTSVSFTGIPSWVKRVTITLYYVDLSGADQLVAKVYTSGGVQASGYVSGTTNSKSTGVNSEFTNSFLVLEPFNAAATGTFRYGSVVFEKVDTAEWVYKSTIYGYTDAAVSVAAGGFSLSDALGRVDITSYNGIVTFVSGSRLNILYE